MPRSHQGFEQLMQRVAQGSEAALWELLESYSSNILRAVRKHLPPEIQSKVDAQDILQSAWRSLLRTGGRLDALTSPDQFAAYLMGIARNKAKEVRRHFTSLPGFDVARETSAHNVASRESLDGGEQAATYLEARGADRPSTIVAARELWQRAMDGTGEQGRRIVELRLQGFTLDEVAAQMELSRSTVRRVLNALLQSLTL